MATQTERPRPVLLPEYCKGCGRCVETCAHHCIEMGTEIHPGTGLMPVVLHLEGCTACGLCLDACPEPYGLRPAPPDVVPPSAPRTEAPPRPIPDEVLPFPVVEPLVIKGNYASAIGALLAGCRHFYGYPITPSTEGAELMARLLPKLGGTFVQAVSEVATVNLMYGGGGAGLPTMTFTSSPGFSLMLEGISYMIGAEVPGVFVNVMRGGPGLGNIAPEQADVKLACRGLGHGNTHAIVLAPATPQEMLDFTMLAFRLAFTYRNPVVVLCDGYLGQMTGKVALPTSMVRPGLPEWAVWGDREHRRNLISSIHLSAVDLEAHNRRLYVERVALYDAKQRVKTQKAVRKALQMQVEGRGFAFVEVLSACPVHLHLTPTEAERWVKEKLVPAFPLGVKKDAPGEVWFSPPKPSFDPATLHAVVGGSPERAPRFNGGFPRDLYGSDVALKFAGAGGDGAQTAALLLTRSAINEGFDATHIPSYGPESRGGTSYADVHVAETEVLSPAAPAPHVLLAFNAPSLEKFGPQVVRGGTVLYDSSVASAPSTLGGGVRAVGVPCARIAADLGKVIVKNIVALGALQAATRILPPQAFLAAIHQGLRDKPALISVNEEAFVRGAAFVQRQ